MNNKTNPDFMGAEQITLTLAAGDKTATITLKSKWQPYTVKDTINDFKHFQGLDPTIELLAVLADQIQTDIVNDKLIHRLLAKIHQEE